MLKLDGFDHCCIGTVERFGQNTVLCYDLELVIKELMSQGMTNNEAYEYFHFNILGAWMGEGTPCFLKRENYEEQEHMEQADEKGGFNCL